MMEILLIILFIVIFVKAVGLALKISWCIAKVVACILFVLAIPVLALCLIFASGLILLLPIGLVVAAFGILKGV